MENACAPGSCCTGKWFCPKFPHFVAGIIMFAAGVSKIVAGSSMLGAVGGMVLGIVGLQDMTTLALVFGWIAAIIEVVGGLSFALGCCKTSKAAAFGLALVIGLAIVAKLTKFSAPDGNLWMQATALLQTVQFDLLLFSVFFGKAWKCCKGVCGKDACCATPATK